MDSSNHCFNSHSFNNPTNSINLQCQECNIHNIINILDNDEFKPKNKKIYKKKPLNISTKYSNDFDIIFALKLKIKMSTEEMTIKILKNLN